MSSTQSVVQSRPQQPLRASKNTRVLTGTFASVSGVLSGLPTNHKITAGDRIDISVAGTTPVALENGIVFASDMSAYLSGALGNIAYLRIDHAQSLFDFPGTYPDQATALAAIQAVFTLGRTIYFDSGIFAGASINIGEMVVAPGQTVHDDTTVGLTPGYWYIILDLASASGFPSLTPFSGETTVSPAVSINDSDGGGVTATGLIVTAAGANTVTIPTGLPDIVTFPDFTVHEHSEVLDVLVAQEMEAQTLKVGGESVIAPVAKILYSGGIASPKVIWSGYNDADVQISGDTPHKTEITPTDVFNNGVDITIIQLLVHPTDKTIGIMVYQDIATSKIYLKGFKYTYESGFVNTFTPFEIVGADSIDIRIGFITAVNYLTKAITATTLVAFGGKTGAGTSVYAGAYSVNVSTLAITDVTTWADTTFTTINSFSDIERVIDAAYRSSGTTAKMAVVFQSGNILWLEDFFTNPNDVASTHVFYHSEVIIGQNSGRALIVNKTEMGEVTGGGGDGTFYPIASNIHARYRTVYTGVLYGELMLLKIDNHRGIGAETMSLFDFNDDPDTFARSHSYFEAIPGNIQNGNTRTENLTFDLGGDKILTYKSYGYYVISDRTTGAFIYLGKTGTDHVTKSDRAFCILINSDTILYYKSGAWHAQKFMPEGPFLAYKAEGGYAITAPPGVKVELPYALEKGKAYYQSWQDNLVGMSPVIDTIGWLAPRRLGIALTDTFFLSEFSFRGTPSYERFAVTYASTLEAQTATATNVVMNPLRTREFLDAAADVMKWEKFTIPYADLVGSGLSSSCNVGITASARKIIHKVVVKHSQAFAGTGLTTATVSVGLDSDHVLFSDPLDVQQAVADAALEFSAVDHLFLDASSVVKAYLELATGDTANLTAGSVDIWFLTSTLQT